MPSPASAKQLAKTSIGQLHASLVFDRRTRVLSDRLGRLTKGCESGLDIGTGDGRIARLIMDKNPTIRIEGIDIMVRPETLIPVTKFDGRRIPFADNSFDAVSFVDVLHHTDNQLDLLREAARVSRKLVVIKDHLSENAFDHATLRFMDWVGNAPHGVVLPYNYASRTQWMDWFRQAGLKVESFDTAIPLYRWPFSVLFGRGLHFIASLQPMGGR